MKEEVGTQREVLRNKSWWKFEKESNFLFLGKQFKIEGRKGQDNLGDFLQEYYFKFRSQVKDNF